MIYKKLYHYFNPIYSLHIHYINPTKQLKTDRNDPQQQQDKQPEHALQGTNRNENTSFQVLRLILANKFSREFDGFLGMQQLRDRDLALNSLENFVARIQKKTCETAI